MRNRVVLEQVGPYALQSEIGWGTMATVYRSVVDGHAEPLAVKVLSPRFTHQEAFFAQLQRQVTAVNQLDHPAIVPVYELGVEKEHVYLVMPLFTGGTLRDRLTQADLSPALLWQAASQVAAALDAAHAVSIIHRDVKPSNILFARDGRAAIADFGLIQFLDTTIHASGLPGTLAYMSPEQFTGGQIDGRTDQYSLAVVLFEALAGRPPFAGNVTQLMFKQVQEPPPLDWLPQPEMAPVFAQALAKKPDERFATVSDFVEALRPFLIEESQTPTEEPVVTPNADDTVTLDAFLAAAARETPMPTPRPDPALVPFENDATVIIIRPLTPEKPTTTGETPASAEPATAGAEELPAGPTTAQAAPDEEAAGGEVSVGLVAAEMAAATAVEPETAPVEEPPLLPDSPDATVIIRPPKPPAPEPEAELEAEPPAAEPPEAQEEAGTAVPFMAAADLSSSEPDATIVVEPPPHPESDRRQPDWQPEDDWQNRADPEATFVVEPPPPRPESDWRQPDWQPEDDWQNRADPEATFVVEPPMIPPRSTAVSARPVSSANWPPPPVTDAHIPSPIKPGAGGAIEEEPTSSGLRAGHVAVVLILLLLFIAFGVAWQRGVFGGTAVADTPTPTVTVNSLTLAVSNPTRKTTWQLGERGGPLEESALPWPTAAEPLRLITSDDALTLMLPGDGQLVLGPDSEILLEPAADPAHLLVEIQQGRLLLAAVGVPLQANTPLDSTALVENGMMGVGYAESPFLFDVDCFSGNCLVTDLDTTVGLTGGERSSLDGGQLAAPEPARHELYGFVTAVATATTAPTGTATATGTSPPAPTQTATATSTPTLEPSATPTLTPTATLVIISRATPRLVTYTCSAPGNFTPNQVISFLWTWSDQLRSNEYMEVRIGPRGGSSALMRSVGSNVEQQGQQWLMNVPASQFFDSNFHDYEWEVVVVRSANSGPAVMVRSARGCIHVEP